MDNHHEIMDNPPNPPQKRLVHRTNIEQSTKIIYQRGTFVEFQSILFQSFSHHFHPKKSGPRLHPLGGIYHQQGSLAGRQRAAHLIGEIHVARGVLSVNGHFKILNPPTPRPGRRLGPPQVWNFSFLAFQGQTTSRKPSPGMRHPPVQISRHLDMKIICFGQVSFPAENLVF